MRIIKLFNMVGLVLVLAFLKWGEEVVLELDTLNQFL